MKTPTILIVLLFAFATKTSLFALANTPVRDLDGDKIELGVEYYVVSWAWRIGGGGLHLAFDPVEKCPEIVVQHISNLQYGLPVTFSTVDHSDDVVYENTSVTVTFIPLRPKLCQTSTTWQVVYDESTGKNLVTLGGVKGESTTVFTLKRQGDVRYAYRFNHLGSDIGRYYDNSNRLIRLVENNDDPWAWVFIKANKIKTIKQVVN